MQETKASYTPGPWEVEIGSFDENDDAMYTLKGNKWLNAADAHLIAAAPELYEALEGCVALIDDWVVAAMARDSLTAAHAALRKARGEA